MNFFKSTYTLLFFFFAIQLSAQELPPINIFSPTQYDAGNQNWSISQSDEDYIYVANNYGLLEFNGSEWNLYTTPNETIMRSVKVLGDKIFTGFYMDFGYWEKNNKGVLEYNSIVKKHTIPLLDDEQFWNIIESNDWILFQSLNRIYLFNLKTNSYKIIEAESQITKIVKVNNTIYFQEFQNGIFKIENGVSELITDSSELINSKLVGVYEKDNRTLFLTQDNGFYFVNDKKVVQWQLPEKDFLLQQSIYSCRQLKNKDFIIGTISNGVIYLTSNGYIDYHINQKNGLSNNTVLSIYEDNQSTIWLGMDNGINSIDARSVFEIYNDKNGLLGTTYCSITKNEYIYLGTNQGLFYKRKESKENFKFIENTQGQVWSLILIDDELYCGHDRGTFIVNGINANKLLDIEGTWDIKKIKENTYIQGNYDGLYVLEKKGKALMLKNKVNGFNSSSKHFEILGKDKIFVNHEYKGIYKLKLDNNFENIIQVEKDTFTGKGIYSSLVKYNEKLLYSYKKGVFQYDELSDSFKKDSIYSLLFLEDEYTSGKLIFDKKENRLWAFSSKNISYLEPGILSDNPIISRIPILEAYRKSASGYENIQLIDSQKYLLGATNGYITVDLKNKNLINNELSLEINSIKVNKLNTDQFIVEKNQYGEFKNQENNIEFHFNIPFFHSFIEPNFKYQLLGHEDKWSDWDTESKVLFKNLPYGEYTFNLKAKIGNTQIEKITSYSFLISKPWYLSTIMVVIYILSVILFSLFMHTFYKKYYNNQQKRILDKKQKEFELKALENEKQLMYFKNEKLQANIDNKNKELASSTMNIIKKNEFLSSIKNELKNGDVNNIKKVVNIIDNNLNNTDDWKLFKEAFNNADKDFIKKLKSIHPDLTPNDLRLCAYLRLNLSSKEIAPLLNISPRSVEVKRYRLRKKIGLSSKDNLVSYILEV